MFNKKIEVANFVCKFGEEQVLLDRLEDVIWPAMQSLKHVREIKAGSLFFVDTELVLTRVGDKEIPVLVGRFVKNTTLKRDQIFREAGLIQDHEELETAPSAIFVLILENHRLLYIKEVPGAPSLGVFASTCTSIFSAEHKQFLSRLKEESRERHAINQEEPVLSLKALVEAYPYPRVRITPMTDRGGLEEFIGKFDRISKLAIKLLPTNHEDINNDDFWKRYEEVGGALEATPQAIFTEKEGKGIKPEEVVVQATAATSAGNAGIKISGVGADGEILRGNNEDFSVTMSMEEVPEDLKDVAVAAVEKFDSACNEGLIEKPVVRDAIKHWMRRFIRRRFNG